MTSERTRRKKIQPPPPPLRAGIVGTLPASLGTPPNLWMVDVTGTGLTCSGVPPADLYSSSARPLAGVQPACPLPGWLRFSAEYFFQSDMLECQGVTFM
jgi:hypothetical protein